MKRTLSKPTAALLTIYLFIALALPDINNAYVPVTEAEEAVTKELIDLRLHHYLEVNSAKKIRTELYEVHVTGMRANNQLAYLYKSRKGSWIFMLTSDTQTYDMFVIEKPAYFFALDKSEIPTDETAPKEIRDFLKPYFKSGRNIMLEAGANFTGVWYPKQVEGEIGHLLAMMGLKNTRFLDANHPKTPAVGDGGLLFQGTYNYLAKGDMIMSMKFDLGAPPPLKMQSGGLKIKDESVDLMAKCKLTASLDFFKNQKAHGKNGRFHFDETDCELKLETEVRIDVNKDKLYFDTAIGIKNMKRANSKAFEKASELKKVFGYDPNKTTLLFMEGDIRGGVWKNIFGKKGFTIEEVKLQAMFEKEAGWRMGIFGQIDFGDQTRMTLAALLPVGAGAAFGDVGLEGSLDKLTLEELAMLPAAIGGDHTYPNSWGKAIKGAGLGHFGLQNVKFTFSPTMSDPSLGIDQSGLTARGTLVAFDKTLGSISVYANDDGIYFDDVVEPFKIGWFELKDARFKGFIPSKMQHSSDGDVRARKKLDFVGQNLLVLFFDTYIEIGGNKERALLSFTPTNAGVEFDANITEAISASFKLRLPMANILHGNVPFEVSGHFHDNEKELRDEVLSIISKATNEATKKIDRSFKSEEDKIDAAEASLASVKKEYEAARAAAQKRADKAEAPLKHAEQVLKEKEQHLNGLHNSYEHWKHKAKSIPWYHPDKKIEAYLEEAAYWTEYEGYKGVIKAAELVVKSLEATTEFIAVDADPLVVEKFSEYNGAKFTLAIAKGALLAAQKATDFVVALPEKIAEGAFDAFEINQMDVSGKAMGSDEFDLNLNVAGILFGGDWNISPTLKIASPKKAAEIAEENLKALANSLSPMHSTIIAHSKSKFHGTDYAQYPPNAALAYAWEKLAEGSSAVDIAAQKDIAFVSNKVGLVFYWTKNKWHKLDGVNKVSRLAIAPNQKYPVLVTRDGRLWHRPKNKKEWERDPVAAQVHDVGVGPKGTIWITNKVGNIYRKKTGEKWEQIPGSSAKRITVDDKENAWITNKVGHIYRWAGSKWEQLEGSATDIGAGGGKIWVIGGKDTIWNFIPGTKKWVKITGSATDIAVDATGLPVVTNRVGLIYKNLGPK